MSSAPGCGIRLLLKLFRLTSIVFIVEAVQELFECFAFLLPSSKHFLPTKIAPPSEAQNQLFFPPFLLTLLIYLIEDHADPQELI